MANWTGRSLPSTLMTPKRPRSMTLRTSRGESFSSALTGPAVLYSTLSRSCHHSANTHLPLLLKSQVSNSFRSRQGLHIVAQFNFVIRQRVVACGCTACTDVAYTGRVLSIAFLELCLALLFGLYLNLLWTAVRLLSAYALTACFAVFVVSMMQALRAAVLCHHAKTSL